MLVMWVTTVIPVLIAIVLLLKSMLVAKLKPSSSSEGGGAPPGSGQKADTGKGAAAATKEDKGTNQAGKGSRAGGTRASV